MRGFFGLLVAVVLAASAATLVIPTSERGEPDTVLWCQLLVPTIADE